MKYFRVLSLLVLFTFVGLTGCSQKESVTSISNVKEKHLKEYSGTYVGDNSKVMAIVQSLPGGETLKDLDLHNKSLRVTYGYNDGSLSEDDILQYWFDGKKTLEKNFLYNAIYLTILVPNAQSYSFEVDNQSFSISRKEMSTFISKNIDSLPSSDELLKEKKAQDFIDRNTKKIDSMVESKDSLKQFFKSFPIKELQG
ncbi:DUF4825 domain-containing protein [Priestia filamentosa]|uniref:DUF4825 domain-containing protein n=1 Tax=Priestia filamentosa TaxID=1402861 RepID=UPI002E1FD840|nr:DUF4825 domain-containing protein [Priestia filamentosa]